MINDTKNTGLKDVAKVANVGLATVDRVVNNRSGVSKKTREKVLKVIQDLNYKPNILARNLSLNKTFNFGIFLPKPNNDSEYWQLPLSGVKKADDELGRLGVNIKYFLFEKNDKSLLHEQISNIIKAKLDGILLTSKFKNEIQIVLDSCKEKGVPYVLIDSYTKDDNALCEIGQSSTQSGTLAGQLFNYCINDGTILIAQLLDEMDNIIEHDKIEEGLRNYFNIENNKIQLEKVVINNLNPNSINKNLKKAFQTYSNIKGIFVPNSKVKEIAYFLNTRVRDKVYLIGFDLLTENHFYLENDIIDFLICHKPDEQAFKGIHALYEHTVLKNAIRKSITMPLDIVTKGNYIYY